jgi:hypothetical protein
VAIERYRPNVNTIARCLLDILTNVEVRQLAIADGWIASLSAFLGQVYPADHPRSPVVLESLDLTAVFNILELLSHDGDDPSLTSIPSIASFVVLSPVHVPAYVSLVRGLYARHLLTLDILTKAMSTCKVDMSDLLIDDVIAQLSECDGPESMDRIASFLATQLERQHLKKLFRSLQQAAPARASFLKYARNGLFPLLTNTSEEVRRSTRECVCQLFPEIERKLTVSSRSLTDATLAAMRQLLTDGFLFFDGIPNHWNDRFVAFTKVIRRILSVLNGFTPENFPHFLKMYNKLQQEQIAWIDYNVLEMIKLLTRFDRSLFKPHFERIYNAVMQRAINQQTVNIFVKFKRYLSTPDLDDVHAILQHPTFAAIKRDLSSPSWNLLIQCLYRFPDDPLVASVLSTFMNQATTSAKNARLQLVLLQSGQLSPTRQQLESSLEFFVNSCAVQISRDVRREAEALENFEVAIHQLRLLFTVPKFSARLDAYDDALYRQAVKFCDGRSAARIRDAMRSFLNSLCATYGSEMRDLLTTLLVNQLALGNDSLEGKIDLIHILLALTIDFGEGVAEALAKHAAYLTRRFRKFDAVAAIADLVPPSGIPDWVAEFWVAWVVKHPFGDNPRDIEFSELALTCASFEQAASFLEQRFSRTIPCSPREWKIAAAIFGWFPDRRDELGQRFAFAGRPTTVTADVAPFVDAIFGPGPVQPAVW